MYDKDYPRKYYEGMKDNIKAFSQRNYLEKCDKCGSFFDKTKLTHIDAIDENFCENCIKIMETIRGEN